MIHYKLHYKAQNNIVFIMMPDKMQKKKKLSKKRVQVLYTKILYF